MGTLEDAKDVLDRLNRRDLWNERRDPDEADFRNHSRRLAAAHAGVLAAMMPEKEGFDHDTIIGCLVVRAQRDLTLTTRHAGELLEAALSSDRNAEFIAGIVDGLQRYEGTIRAHFWDGCSTAEHQLLNMALSFCKSSLKIISNSENPELTSEKRAELLNNAKEILYSDLWPDILYEELEKMYPEIYKKS